MKFLVTTEHMTECIWAVEAEDEREAAFLVQDGAPGVVLVDEISNPDWPRDQVPRVVSVVGSTYE